MMSTTLSGGDPTVVTQCLDFCQALASMVQTISLIFGSTFSLNLDTRRRPTAPSEKVKIKKKLSPSTLKRNQRRKQDFQKQKVQSSSEFDITVRQWRLFSVNNVKTASKL